MNRQRSMDIIEDQKPVSHRDDGHAPDGGGRAAVGPDQPVKDGRGRLCFLDAADGERSAAADGGYGVTIAKSGSNVSTTAV